MKEVITVPLSEYQRLQLALSDYETLLPVHRELLSAHEELLLNYQQLERKVDDLDKQIKKTLSENENLVAENALFKETILSLRDQLFGKKKDKIKGNGQHLNKIQFNKEKKKRGRKPQDEGWKPDETRSYDYAELPKCCLREMHVVGVNESRHKEYQICLKNVKIAEVKYACRCCNKIVVVKGSKLPIPKGVPLPGLLTQVILDKFSSATPLYRQAQNYDYMDINYSRQQLSHWVSRSAYLVEPLYNLLFTEIENSAYLMADETHVTLLNVEGKDPGSKGYICVIKQGGSKIFNFVYCFAIDSRTQDVIEKKLAKFKGHLQTDGLNFYFKLLGKEVITYVACWSHVRRKFTDIIKISGKSEGIAFEVVQQINKLYKIEHDAAKNGLDYLEVLKLRKKEAIPILDKLKNYLTEVVATTSPKGSLGNAIKYTLDRWDGLAEYTNGGNLEIDNNATERCIKYVVMGRKNWLFADNIDSAGKLAMLYSLVITCKFNNVNPREYLEYIFTQLPYINRHDVAELRNLLPDRYDVAKRYDLEYRRALGIVETITIGEDITAEDIPKAA